MNRDFNANRDGTNVELKYDINKEGQDKRREKQKDTNCKRRNEREKIEAKMDKQAGRKVAKRKIRRSRRTEM